MDKFRVTLTKEERGELKGLLSKGRHAARKLTHARVLLLADACIGIHDEDIAGALMVSGRTIARVRKRFVTEGLAAALDHRTQPRRPGKVKIKGDIEQELIRIACGDPPEGRCHWTLQLLADEMVALGLVKKLSHETVRQALKKPTSSRG
jgi:transposase